MSNQNTGYTAYIGVLHNRPIRTQDILHTLEYYIIVQSEHRIYCIHWRVTQSSNQNTGYTAYIGVLHNRPIRTQDILHTLEGYTIIQSEQFISNIVSVTVNLYLERFNGKLKHKK